MLALGEICSEKACGVAMDKGRRNKENDFMKNNVKGLEVFAGVKAPNQQVLDAGPELQAGEKVVELKGTTERGHEEEASGGVCLYVCEAFTSSTLAVKFWFPS